MRKNSTKVGKHAKANLRGKPGAANWLGVSVPVIKKAIKDGTLAYILDDSGKHLFDEPALRAFRRIYKPGNRNKRTYRAGKGRV